MDDNEDGFERRQRRRILIDEEEENVLAAADDDEVVSNPDELIDEDVPSDDESGEDLYDTLHEDYVAAPELDQYDTSGLVGEDEVYETYAQRMAYQRQADEEIDARYALNRERLLEQDRGLEGEVEAEAEALDDDELLEDMDDEEREAERLGAPQLNLEQFDSPLREWIVEERTREEIKRRFKRFLERFYRNIDDVEKWEREHSLPGSSEPVKLPSHLKKLPPKYPNKIKAMCSSNKSSLEIEYCDLGDNQPLLAIWLTDIPKEMLSIFDEVLQSQVKMYFPFYDKISSETHVRIVNLPLADSLRDLRQKDLNNLIKVCGVVTKRGGVYPKLRKIMYECTKCQPTNKIGPFDSVQNKLMCKVCDNWYNIRINVQETEYRNHQTITLQESPGSVPAGRVPRYKDIILLDDLIDVARPGEEIEVTGIYTHIKGTDRSGFPVFNTNIEANHIRKVNDMVNSTISDEDKRKIRDLSQDPLIRERIIRSIAPSIYGHRHVKTAIAMALFGGCAKDSGVIGSHRVRGDINVLLLGDPGTAKSQVLKYAEKTAPRSVYTTGKGASAVGLTAGVHRDHITKEWTLEGGALVLADQGVCIIDEFDKMNEQDRTSIHEAMEQQTISVSKAGIVASLQARCAVLAAANPIGGRYDPSYNLTENVELTDPILQRFDILCVLQDTVDPVKDEQLAMFVVNSHMKSHPEGENMTYIEADPSVYEEHTEQNSNTEDSSTMYVHNNSEGQDYGNDYDMNVEPIPQELLKKYIQYARAFSKPVIQDIDSKKLESLYADLRHQSALSGGVPIAVRHLESIIRMAEATAKMHLRDHVRDEDVDMAIKVTLESFLQAQKISVRRQLQHSFRKYITYGEEINQLLKLKLDELVRKEGMKYSLLHADQPNIEIKISEFEYKAKSEMSATDAQLRQFYVSNTFRKHRFYVDTNAKLIRKEFSM